MSYAEHSARSDPMRSYATAVDLSESKQRFAGFVGGLITVCDSGGADGIGIIVTPAPAAANPSASHLAAVGVAQRGVHEVICGAAINAGQAVTSDEQGRAIACSSGSWSFGQSKTVTTQVGEWVSVHLLIPPIRVRY